MHLVLTLDDGTKVFLFLSGNFSFHGHEEGTRIYEGARPDGYFVKETPQDIMAQIQSTMQPVNEPVMAMPPATENNDVV